MSGPYVVRILVSLEEFLFDQLTLEGERFHYLARVHRLATGDALEVVTGQGEWARALVSSKRDNFMVIQYIEKGRARMAGPRLTLFQGLPKGRKIDLIVEKATELGVVKIVPVLAARSIPEKGDFHVRRQRWQRIANSASLQSRRAMVPEIAVPMSFADALAEAKAAQLKLFVWEESRQTSLRAILQGAAEPAEVAVWIGPEGGWTVNEAQRASADGAVCVGLGENILRTETAGFAMLSILGFWWGGLAPQA